MNQMWSLQLITWHHRCVPLNTLQKPWGSEADSEAAQAAVQEAAACAEAGKANFSLPQHSYFRLPAAALAFSLPPDTLVRTPLQSNGLPHPHNFTVLKQTPVQPLAFRFGKLRLVDRAAAHSFPNQKSYINKTTENSTAKNTFNLFTTIKQLIFCSADRLHQYFFYEQSMKIQSENIFQCN